jgi:hypothetical protein
MNDRDPHALSISSLHDSLGNSQSSAGEFPIAAEDRSRRAMEFRYARVDPDTPAPFDRDRFEGRFGKSFQTIGHQADSSPHHHHLDFAEIEQRLGRACASVANHDEVGDTTFAQRPLAVGQAKDLRGIVCDHTIKFRGAQLPDSVRNAESVKNIAGRGQGGIGAERDGHAARKC